MQCQLHAFGAEDRTHSGELRRVLGAAVIEPRLQLHHELHGAARYPQLAHQAMPVRWLALDDRHEVQYLADAVGRQEPGDEHGGVREVQLPGDVVTGGRSDLEVTAVVGVQQGREDAR